MNNPVLLETEKTESDPSLKLDDPLRDQKQREEDFLPPSDNRTGPVIRKFLIGWAISFAILCLVAALTDIDWAKPFLQRAMSSIMHRNVRLGHLAWNYSPGGLTVEIARLSILEKNGAPFLKAGHTDIGLAFFPLLKKQVIIKHITLDQPEIWAVRTKEHLWNYEDLFSINTNIQFLQANRGTIHIVDATDPLKPKWQPLVLESSDVKFAWPQKHLNTPFFITFKVTRPKYQTKVQFTSIGGGPHEWRNNKYKFDLVAEKLNMDDFGPLVSAIGEIRRDRSDLPVPTTPQSRVWKDSNAAKESKPAKGSNVDAAQSSNRARDRIDGLFDVQVAGEGIFSQGMTADVHLQSENFSIQAEPFGVVSAPANSEMKLVLDRQKLRWHDLILKLANIEFHSKGEMSDWKSPNSSYSATVDGQLNKFNDLNDVIETPKSATAKRLVELGKMDIKGQANIELSANRQGDTTEILTKMNTKGLQIKPFLDQNAAHLSPIMKLLGLADNALLTGNLEFKPNEQLKIVQGDMPLAGGDIKASGLFNLREAKSDVQFTATNIHLSSLKKNVEKASGSSNAFLGNFFYIPPNKHLDLSGILNATGTLSTSASSASGEGKGSLRDATVALSDGSLNARQIQGVISWQAKKLLLKQLKGTVGDAGAFLLDGWADLRNTPYVDWTIKAEHLDLKQLSALMKSVRIQAPLFSESHLFGTVKTLDLRVVGPRDNPAISFIAVPENMYYQPPGLSRPLKSVSGVIVYKNDTLTLSDVAFVSHGDAVKTSFTIENLSGAQAKLTNLSVNTSGIDLSDVHFYLSSCLMPQPLKKIYLNFLKDNKIFDAHGRTSCDLTCKFNGDKVALAGSANLHDIQARVLRPDVLLKHIGGEIHVIGDDLVLQKVQGSYRDSDVFVDGKILKYAQDNPMFQIQLKASLKPNELAQLLPVVSDQMKRWHMNISSEHTVDVTSDYTGDNDSSKIQFLVKGDPGARLSLTSQFGDFYQPKDESVMLDGVVASTKDGFEINDSHIQVGKSILHLSGRLGEFDKSPEALASKNTKYGASWDGQPIRISLSSLSPISISHLLSTLDPAFKSKDVGGELTGNLVLEGNIPDIYPTGEVKISKLSIDSVNVHDAQGSIKLLGRTEKHDNIRPIAKLRLPTLNVGPIIARDCDVDLALEYQGPDAGLIKITEADAKVADGKADISGSIDLSHQKLNLNISLNEVSASKLTEELTKQKNQMTGTANVTVNVETHGTGWQQALDNLGGKGMIEMSNGSFAKLGHLETQLHRGNLLHQGLLGFNMGSFVQSVIPTKVGVYNDLAGEFRFDKNELLVDQFKYNSNDMYLWSSGSINLKNSTLKMTVAGKIPRISSGMVKDVSKAMSVSSFVHVATLGRLKSLPSIPILGAVSNANRANTFEFRLDAPLDEPRAINQSAIKTFHWLPNLPTASAHPVLLDVN